jgi:hypothetical protein
MWFVVCTDLYLWGYKSAKSVVGITLEAQSIPGGEVVEFLD